MTAEVPPLTVLLARWDRFVWRAVNRHARRLALDPDEVRAEALAEMVARYPRFDPARPNASFPSWARLVVRRAAARLSRPRAEHAAGCGRGRAANGVVLCRELPDPVERATDPRAADPAERVAGAEVRTAITAAVEALPPEQREAVRLRFWAGAQLSGHGWEQLRAGLEALREQLAGLNGEEP